MAEHLFATQNSTRATIFNGPEGVLPLVGFDASGRPNPTDLEVWRPRYKDHTRYIIGHHKDGRVIRAMAGGTEHLFLVQNSTRATTAVPVKQPTGTAIRTMLQIATGAAQALYVVEWGISFDGSAAAAGIQTEFLNCTGAATMSTALAATDVTLFTHATDTATVSAIQYGTALSGFATAAVTEGTVANYRTLDLQMIQPTNQYVKQWPLGREPGSGAATFNRVRVTSAASVGAWIYQIWAE